MQQADLITLTNAAQAAELAGDTHAAIAAWQGVLAVDSCHRDAVFALAGLYAEAGQWHDAIVLLEPRAIVAPSDEDLQRELLDLFISAGEFERAKRHADACDARSPGRAWRAYVDATETGAHEQAAFNGRASAGAQPHAAASATPTSDDVFGPGSFEPLFTLDHAVRLHALFAGRADVFARQWVADDGATGYAPVYKPYTPKVVYNHLLGNFTTGIYLARPDGTARILAFDIDINADAINAARGSASRADELRATALGFAAQLAGVCRTAALNPVLESSGYKGAHVWILFDDWLPCAKLRRCGQILIGFCGALPDNLALELFPKQKGAPTKLGNLIKLPLGIHRKTGRRSLLLAPDAAPMPDQAQALMQLGTTPASVMQSLLDAHNTPTPNTSGPLPSPSAAAHDSAADSASTQPNPLDLVTAAHMANDPIVAHLLARCPVLAALIRRVQTAHYVSYDERLVLEHTLGHLPQGPLYVNFLLKHCENMDTRFFMKNPHRGSPASCARIAARIPHIVCTCQCNCEFGAAIANYPTPLNHLYSYVMPAHVTPLLPAPALHGTPAEPPSPHATNAVALDDILNQLFGPKPPRAPNPTLQSANCKS